MFLCFSTNAVEIKGNVKKIYVQGNKVYFNLADETTFGSPYVSCHGSNYWKYYYFYIDNQAISSDPDYLEKRYTSYNYFQLLMLSAASKNLATTPIPVIIDISSIDYQSNCGASSIHINYLKVY